jgi:hypothetical protein
MQTAMALSALISPKKGTDGKKAGERNIVVNMWDWNVCASWDDGETWAAWADGEKSPMQCGEGGGGTGMGASGRLAMWHRNNWWSSADGGHNFEFGSLPGSMGAFEYVVVVSKGARVCVRVCVYGWEAVPGYGRGA